MMEVREYSSLDELIRYEFDEVVELFYTQWVNDNPETGYSVIED